MQQINLLQASVDAEDDSDLRILLDGKHVKYLTIRPGVYEAEDMCFEPTLKSILPPLPGGNWVQGTIAKDPATHQPSFTPSTATSLPGITHIWHDHSIEYLNLSIGKKLRTNVYEAYDPELGRPVMLKFARFTWEIPQIDAETQAYSWIKGQRLGPEFLGHVKEDGRVIGFIMERVQDVRHAEPGDLALCQSILSKLHGMKIKHGDINKHNFLVGKDERVWLIDFDWAEKEADESSLVEEWQSLENELKDLSGRGGETTIEAGT